MAIIRTATFQDLDQLAVLFDEYRVFYGKSSDGVGAKTFLKRRMENNESVLFVSSNEEGSLTGFTQLYPLFSSTRLKKLWLLNDLFVHTDFRGQGISLKLIEQAKEHCRTTGACGLILGTAKTNEIGNNLYPRAGFTQDTDSNHYFWDLI